MSTLSAAIRKTAPSYLLGSVATLGVAIGVAAAFYSVVESALQRQSPLQDADTVMNLYASDPFQARMASAVTFTDTEYQYLLRSNRSLMGILAWSRMPGTLSTDLGPQVALGEAVSGNYFALVKPQPIIGRAIDARDDIEGAPLVILLSEFIWRTYFRADPNVVGRLIRLNGATFFVIGVIPQAFRGFDMPTLRTSSFWIPLSSARELRRTTSGSVSGSEPRWLLLKGRLRSEMTAASAAAELATLGLNLEAAMNSDKGVSARPDNHWTLLPSTQIKVHESIHRLANGLRASMAILLIGVVLIAATNVSNVALAQVMARRYAIAVRLALGGSDRALALEELTSVALLAAGGGLLGMLIASYLVHFVLSLPLDIGQGVILQVDADVSDAFVFTAALACFICLAIFGTMPAIRVARGNLREILNSEAVSHVTQTWRRRRALIALQVFVSFSLLAMAGHYASAIEHTARRVSSTGFDLISISLDFSGSTKSDQARLFVIEETMRLIKLDPRIDGIAMFSEEPNTTPIPTHDKMIGGPAHEAAKPTVIRVSQSMLELLRINDTVSDSRGNRPASSGVEPSAVVSRRAARILFGTPTVVGREIITKQSNQQSSDTQSDGTRRLAIRGVSAQLDETILTTPNGIVLILSDEFSSRTPSFLIRSRSSEADIVSLVTTHLAHAGGADVPARATNYAEIAKLTVGPLKIAATFASILGVLATVLAMTGLYGVLSYLIQRRVAEIGIRIVLGATPLEILRLVILDGAKPVGFGIAVGLVFALFAVLTFASPRDGRPQVLDNLLLILTAGSMLIVSTVASLGPAIRAMNISPAELLRRH